MCSPCYRTGERKNYANREELGALKDVVIQTLEATGAGESALRAAHVSKLYRYNKPVRLSELGV